MPDMTPYYKPGQDLSVLATAALTGCRLVAISGDVTSGPGLVDTIEGSYYRVGKPQAGGRVLGVLTRDTASGAPGTVVCEGVVAVFAQASITAWEEVEADAEGRAVPLSTGVAVGVALADAAQNELAQIKLYGGPGGQPVS